MLFHRRIPFKLKVLSVLLYPTRSSFFCIANCQVFGSIREKYGDLKDDESLVNFFNEVLKMRDEIDEKEGTSSNESTGREE